MGAKLLFILTFIHLPLLLAYFAMVTARGFHPLESLPAIAWKQVVIAGALSLPAAALATITKNLAQLTLVAVVTLATASITLHRWFAREWVPAEYVRHGMVWLILIGASVVIVGLMSQYAPRWP